MLLLIAAIGPAGSEVRATLARTHLPSAGSQAKATLARSKPTPYARDGGSNVSAPRQHYLQVDRHWTPYSKATTLSWFDRVSTLEKGVDVLTCGIEKNGITLLNGILAEVMGRKFEWFPANPSTETAKALRHAGATHGSKGSHASSADLIDAASKGDLDAVKRLVEEQKIPIDVGDYDSRTPLHLAAGEGRQV